MQIKPSAWNDGSPLTFFAQVDPEAWPSDRTDLPAGFVEAGRVSIQRDLTGGGLPGSARGASGMSVSTGSVTLPQLPGAVLSPFGNRRVQAGGPCRIWAFPSGRPPREVLVGFAAADAAAWAELGREVGFDPAAPLRWVPTLQGVPLGSMRLKSLAGSASSPEVSASIEERPPGVAAKFTADFVASGAEGTFDASLVIAEAARQSGFMPSWTASDRAEWESTFTSFAMYAPLIGGVTASVGSLVSAASPRWSNRGGRQWYTGGALTYDTVGRDTSFGTGTWSSTSRGIAAQVDLDGGSARISTPDLTVTVAPGGITVVAGSFTRTLAIPSPGRAQGVVHAYANVNGGVLSVSCSYYVGGGVESVNQSYTGAPTFTQAPIPERVTVTPLSGAGIRDLAVTTQGWINSDLEVVFPPNAFIEHAGAPLYGVFGLAGKSCWDVIQEVARATMGAAWIDETGALIYRSRESLRGGTPVERVSADENLEDVPWSITDDETADRVVVTYTPAAVATSPTSSLSLWEATAPISIGKDSTRTITQDIESASDRVAAFAPIWADSSDPSGLKGSKWAAALNRDGSGARPADNALSVSARMLTPFKVQITITNNTNNTLWLVDGNGNPLLTVRTSRKVEPGEPETVEWGKSEATATNAFQFDAGQWVQDSTTANEMLTWLVSQFQAQQPTLDQVRVKPDLARQLGDIILLTEDKRTQEHRPLKAKALITGITLEAGAGEVSQTLNLALLTDVFRDFDAWCQANGIDTFDQLDAALNTAGINTFDQFDEWAARTLVDY